MTPIPYDLGKTLFSPLPGPEEDYASPRVGEWWEVDGYDRPVKVLRLGTRSHAVAGGYLRNDVYIHPSRFLRPVTFPKR